MNRRATRTITAVLGFIVLSLGVSSIISNATEPAKSPLRTAPAAPPPPMAQMNETQQLRIQVQRLEAQVSKLSGDVATMRSEYDTHSHSPINMAYTGTHQLEGSKGFSLLSGGEGARVPTSYIVLSRPQRSSRSY